MHRLIPLSLCVLLLACTVEEQPSVAVAPVSDSSENTFDQATLQAAVDKILPRVEELRGWKFSVKVPAGVHSPDEFMAYAMKEFEEEYGKEKFIALGESYALLGLIGPEVDFFQTFLDLLRGQVGGYYDPKEKKFFMIDAFNQGPLADIIMAHELTHALDDQRFDLLQMGLNAKGNSDEEFAMRSVAEGSGTNLMSLYTTQGAVKGWLDPMQLMKDTMAMQKDQTEALQKAPAFLVMTLSLPYLEGNKFLLKTTNAMAAMMGKPKNEDLDQAFRFPPRSSEQILHPEKYWDPLKKDEPMAVHVSDFSDKLGDGWTSLDSDTLGELGCYALTAREMPSMATAAGQMASRFNQASSGWGGDAYRYFRKEGGGKLLFWKTVWDTEKDAVEFSEAIEMKQKGNPFYYHQVLTANRVLVTFADSVGIEDFNPSDFKE